MLRTYEVLAADRSMIYRMLKFINEQFDSKKNGGFIYLNPSKSSAKCKGTALLPIGNIPDDKIIKYCIFAQEKAARLEESPSSITTSYATRDPEHDKWGGAVQLPNNTIISFSGLPELGDEALVLMYAYYKRWITAFQAHNLSNDRRQFEDLLDSFDFSD